MTALCPAGCYNRAVDRPREQLLDALRLYHSGDLPRAQMLLETLALDQLEPEVRLEANYLWGVVLARRGEALEASQHFQQCVSQNPRFFPALDAWGNVLAGIGDARGAIEKYRRALGVAGRRHAAHILFNYGSVLLRAGNASRALRKFRESFRLDPLSGDASYMAGLCYLNLARARGARKWLAQSIKLQPDSARNHTALGNAFALEGRDTEAVAAFSRALQHEPEYHDAWYNWAANLGARGDYAGAIRTAKAGLAHHPRSFELITQQVYGLRQMGAYDAALQAIKRARAHLADALESERAPHFEDLLTTNEAATLRALGRVRQARGVLLAHLRYSPEACPNALGELRRIDARPLSRGQRIELTLRVQPARDAPWEAEEAPNRRAWQRTYWVIAPGVKEARRMVRDLEPADANVRFEGEAGVIEELQATQQAILERTPAMP